MASLTKTIQAGLFALMLWAAWSGCSSNRQSTAMLTSTPAKSTESDAPVKLDLLKGATDESLRSCVGRRVVATGWWGMGKPGYCVHGADPFQNRGEIYILSHTDRGLKKENEFRIPYGSPVEVTGVLLYHGPPPAPRSVAPGVATTQLAQERFYFDVEEATVTPVKRYVHSMPTASPAIASATHPTADPAANIAYPLWDGKETVPQYAKRAGIKETQLTLDLGNNVPMKLTLIPAGKFIMGSPKNEEGRQDRDYKGKADREGPQREVTITKPFYMGVYPVTQRQYEAILDRIPSRFFGPDNPVEQVYWDDAPEFCKTLSEKTGMEVALPTEAQWEYACRAGTTTRFYFGDDADYSKLGDYAWYTKNSEWKTHPVGLKKPNPWGLYDMYGNVEQQCADWYGNDYYKRTSNTDPTGPQSGEYRVMRGESWIAQAHECRSAGRGILYGGDGYLYGFRVIVKLK